MTTLENLGDFPWRSSNVDLAAGLFRSKALLPAKILESGNFYCVSVTIKTSFAAGRPPLPKTVAMEEKMQSFIARNISMKVKNLLDFMHCDIN